MEAHDLHHHLIGVGGAVEGAGAGLMVGAGFAFEELGGGDEAFGVPLTEVLALVVGEAGGHGAAGDEDGGEMAEGERADDEAGDDLVADAEVDGGVEGLVRECDGGGEGDDVAGEEGELHAGFALGDAVAHGGDASGNLGDATGFAGSGADDLGEALVGLMSGEHVVVGGDDGDVAGGTFAENGFIVRCAGSESVGLIGAAQALAARLGGGCCCDGLEVAGARGLATLNDAMGNFCDSGVHDVDASVLMR